MNIIDAIIQASVRKQFFRAMRFDEKAGPFVPPPETSKPRLLYLHIPFCEQLCPYCSFHRVPFEPSVAQAYFNALNKEIYLYREMGYDFSGIYVGGGTPTVMTKSLVSTLSLARSLFNIREISVETNPNHLTDENIKLLLEVGVNRLSVGVQSFDDGLLSRMDRYEKYGSGKEIASRLRSVQGTFQTLNADMMFNFPTQTEDILLWDLEVLKKLSLDQITYYPLMVSTTTKRLIKARLGETSFGREADYYRLIVDNLTHDYNFSSAWCFSRKQSMIDEYIVDYDEYAGLGSGSIGYINGTCYANTFNIVEYISRLEKGELPLMASRTFGQTDRIRYDFLMQLFATRLYRRRLKGKYGHGWWKPILLPFFVLFITKRIKIRGQWWELTPRGCYTWVVMMREFFTAVNNFRDYCRKGNEGKDVQIREERTLETVAKDR